MSQNWRTRVDAQDHFGQQKRISEIEQRRPVIRRPADLGLGPGIGAGAIKVTNWNDLLALYNGYFASEAGTYAAPNETDRFIGVTIMDAHFGGVQLLTSLVSGNQYKRVFRRNPSDIRSVTFGSWEWTNEPPEQYVPNDTGWLSLSSALTGSWGIKYRKVENFVNVIVDGAYTTASGTTYTINTSTLPAAYRPPTPARCAGYFGAHPGLVSVLADGNISAVQHTGANRGSIAVTIGYFTA